MTKTINTDIADSRKNLVYPLEETRFHKLIVKTIRILFKPIMSLNVSGMEYIPNKGPAIIAANHVSNMDVFPLQLTIERPIYFMGKAELFENAFIHYLFRQMGGFPVYRGERDEWAIDHAKKILEMGNLLGMFPEGTRSRGRGLKVARTGAARLAIDLQCPVIPISIDGSNQFFKNFPKKIKVNVVIGKQIVSGNGELPIAMTDRIMIEIARNLPIELRGVYQLN
jgi:1-acyl-sn-glycerol-3-phosphate acyltransferase